MAAYALVKDGVVINVVLWDGSEIDFGEGIDAVAISPSDDVSIGYFYADGVFTQPEPSEEEQKQKDQEIITANSIEKSTLLNIATQQVSILQDAVDLDIATDVEATALPLWKKYRVYLSRIDVSLPVSIDWPQSPDIP